MHAHLLSLLPDGARADRERALAAFVTAGFPDRNLEAWHYTDLSALSAQPFRLASGGMAASFALDTCERLEQGAVHPSISAPGFALDNLNAAFAVKGVDCRIEGSQSLPKLISHPPVASGEMAHYRHRITLAEGAQATLILWHCGTSAGGDASLLSVVLECQLAANSRLQLVRLQQGGVATATSVCHVRAVVGAGASLTTSTLDLSSSKSRFELEVQLAAAGARVEVLGLTAIGEKAHADCQVSITHAAPSCTSVMDFRLLAAGKAKAIFNGKVVVNEGAVKTDSQTHCSSLLLSATAEIDAKPELEINADDVKCAHGSTFGQLDDEAAFYLRSRGIGEAEVRALLTQAFSQSVVERLPLPGIRAVAESSVAALLAGATT